MESEAGLPDPLFHSSAECWAVNSRLTAWTLSLADPAFVHQHAVDAYAAQHAGPQTKTISTVFGLLGLYWSVERGWTGRQVQLGHMRLARRRRAWPRLTPPSARAQLTVRDVADAPEPARIARLQDWCAHVWSTWAAEQAAIRAWGDASWE